MPFFLTSFHCHQIVNCHFDSIILLRHKTLDLAVFSVSANLLLKSNFIRLFLHFEMNQVRFLLNYFSDPSKEIFRNT